MKEVIWLYGNIEFYFNHLMGSNDQLDMIFSDHFYKNFDGGEVFKIDKWIFSDFNKLEQIKFNLLEEIINKEKIKFKLSEEYNGDRINMDFESGVRFYFDKDDFENNHYFSAISNVNEY